MSARAGLASPSEKKAMIRATSTDLRMMLLLLSGDAPVAQRGSGARDTLPLYGTKSGDSSSVQRLREVSGRLAGNRSRCDRDARSTEDCVSPGYLRVASGYGFWVVVRRPRSRTIAAARSGPVTPPAQTALPPSDIATSWAAIIRMSGSLAEIYAANIVATLP